MDSRRQSRSRPSRPKGRSVARTEKMNVAQARKFLGVSPGKMTWLLSTGVIPYFTDPVDLRVKLIKRSDLEAFLNKRKQD